MYQPKHQVRVLLAAALMFAFVAAAGFLVFASSSTGTGEALAETPSVSETTTTTVVPADRSILYWVRVAQAQSATTTTTEPPTTTTEATTTTTAAPTTTISEAARDAAEARRAEQAAAAEAPRQAEAAAAAQAAAEAAEAARAASGLPPDSYWDRMARCETGGNWAHYPDGRWSGGLGIYEGTWDAWGGEEFAPNAGHATREQQIIVANRIATQGYGSVAPVGYSGWGCVKTVGYP